MSGARARGGKPVAGARLGVLMLETRFPRIPGDVGNARTWPFPVLYRVVRGATPERVVKQRAEGLLDAFLAAAADLVADGAEGIAANCGFLSLLQAEIADCAVPVATSSLMQVPFVERLLPPGRRAGVLTIAPQSLTAEHLAAAGAAPDTPIGGTGPDTEFARVILGDEIELDVDAAERDLLAAGRRLLAAHPEVGAVVLECTNMGPYTAALRATLGVPVFDMVSFLNWFHAGLGPRRFGPD